MSDLVGNPEDRFSHNEAHKILVTVMCLSMSQGYIHNNDNSQASSPQMHGQSKPNSMYTLMDRDNHFNQIKIMFLILKLLL